METNKIFKITPVEDAYLSFQITKLFSLNSAQIIATLHNFPALSPTHLSDFISLYTLEIEHQFEVESKYIQLAFGSGIMQLIQRFTVTGLIKSK